MNVIRPFNGIFFEITDNLQFARPPEQRMISYSNLRDATLITVYIACCLE